MANNKHSGVTLLLCGALFLLVTLHFAVGAPTGASIVSNDTKGAAGSTAESRNDSGGSITILVLNALQQNQNWKGYVGNVTGALTLDSAAGYTLYDWELNGGITGEVYVARNQSVDFTDLGCANTSNIAAENLYFNMSQGDADTINATYYATSHSAVTVGGLGVITADTCPSTATYINSTNQTLDGSQTFQALVLQEDTSGSLVFLTVMSDDTDGFDNDGELSNYTYDFQIIIPESDEAGRLATTYYFWTELG